jgi:glyoxylase I family protein
VTVQAFSHVGICVSDLERSVAFYTEGLGFERAESHTIGPEFGRLMEVDGVELRSQFLRRDGASIELLHFESPGSTGDDTRRAMNELGHTQLCVRVTAVDAVAKRLVGLGGAVHRGTRTTFGEPGPGALDFVYCTDPDGVRIELMAIPG